MEYTRTTNQVKPNPTEPKHSYSRTQRTHAIATTAATTPTMAFTPNQQI